MAGIASNCRHSAFQAKSQPLLKWNLKAALGARSLAIDTVPINGLRIQLDTKSWPFRYGHFTVIRFQRYSKKFIAKGILTDVIFEEAWIRDMIAMWIVGQGREKV